MLYFLNKGNPQRNSPTFPQNSWKYGLLALVCLTLAFFLIGQSNRVAAQATENKAGLVIQFPGNDVETFCIPFDGDTISGLDVLSKSGLLLKVEAFGGMGAEVCQIGQTGCDYPNATCACQSYGVNGVYWSYHHLLNGQWKASLVGAGSYKVHPGDVEGWSWSGGTPPALYTFNQLCPAAEPPTDVPPTPTQPEPTPVPTSIPTAPPPPTDTAQPTRTHTPTRTPRPVPPGPSPTSPPQPQITLAPPTPTLIALIETPTMIPLPPTETPTSTTEPTLAATSTLVPTHTATIVNSSTSMPTIVATNTPLATATPAPLPPNPEGTARTLGIYIAGGVAVALAVWGIVNMARRRSQKPGEE